MTKLRGFYNSLGLFSVQTQTVICDDLALRPKGLVERFVKAIEQNAPFDNRAQPFLPENSEVGRGTITEIDKNDNRIFKLLKDRQPVRVSLSFDQYEFHLVERKVPPKRIRDAWEPDSGRGGIDYIAIRNTTPILGEIKVRNDTNSFYAFIQLLTYLSEMATSYQIERANRHGTFAVDLGPNPTFDLHILLADFNDRGKKGPLICSTHRLAKASPDYLDKKYPEKASLLGNNLCLKLNTQRFQQAGDSIELYWGVP